MDVSPHYMFAGIAISIAFIVFSVAWGISRIAGKAMDNMARQPQAAEDIRKNIGMLASFIEGIGMVAIVGCVGILAKF